MNPVMNQPGGPPQPPGPAGQPLPGAPVGGAPGQGGSWMQPPGQMAGVPPGLEYLTQLDQILAHQIVSLMEAFTGWETTNKYAIKNSMGQQCYYAFEESGACMRQCCKANREFNMHIVNNHNQEVMKIYRPFKCCSGCCWCAGCCDHCAQELVVESPPGTMIGRVKQLGTGWKLKFSVEDAHGNTQLIVNGPCCTCACCSDVEFPVMSNNEQQQVGMVSKQWTGFVKEAFTKADNFGITFPMDLDVKTKATLIGAMFLIDFMAFENDQNNNNNSDN